jgi:hypothetical protein
MTIRVGRSGGCVGMVGRYIRHARQRIGADHGRRGTGTPDAETGEVSVEHQPVVHDEFPDDWDEAMGIVLGSAIEPVMASGLEGQITNRIRFAEALNSYGGADWQFRYIDPERYSDRPR